MVTCEEEQLTTESIRGRAVDVGFRVPLVVVLIDSLALIILVDESNDEVCRLEFEWRRRDLFKFVVGSFSTFCNRSGMSMAFPLLAAACEGSSVEGVGSSGWVSERSSTATRLGLAGVASKRWMRSFKPEVRRTKEDAPVSVIGVTLTSLRAEPLDVAVLVVDFFSSTRRPRCLG